MVGPFLVLSPSCPVEPVSQVADVWGSLVVHLTLFPSPDLPCGDGVPQDAGGGDFLYSLQSYVQGFCPHPSLRAPTSLVEMWMWRRMSGLSLISPLPVLHVRRGDHNDKTSDLLRARRGKHNAKSSDPLGEAPSCQVLRPYWRGNHNAKTYARRCSGLGTRNVCRKASSR